MPTRLQMNDGTTWQRPLRSFLGLAMVILLVVVSCLLVGLDYRRARNAAMEQAGTSMRVFAERLVDRLGVLSGDTVTLVGMAAAAPNSLVVPPPERLNDKIVVLREGMSHSPHIDGAYVGYPDGSFFHVINLQAGGWRTALHAPNAAKMAVRTIEIDASGARLNRLMFLDAHGSRLSEGATHPSPTKTSSLESTSCSTQSLIFSQPNECPGTRWHSSSICRAILSFTPIGASCAVFRRLSQ